MSPLSPAAIQLRTRLHQLYADGSKHAVYQSIPEFVSEALQYKEPIDELWRSDTPRYAYLSRQLAISPGSVIADVGANTGYFALSVAHSHPTCRVDAFEPNERHCLFIAEIAKAFSLENVTTSAEGWTLAKLESLPSYDVTFLLNTLHHAGFDYDLELADDNAAFEAYATDYLRRLNRCTRVLCFQIGSNRGGDKDRPVHPYNDDVKRLSWCSTVLRASGWNLKKVGFAARNESGGIVYEDLPPDLLEATRNGCVSGAVFERYFAAINLAQFPGEFHRRPLLVCETTQSRDSVCA